ncbi:MAG TPA: DoxX family protein [Gemmatimonadaceae bacterium]|nr:DoxX family protein [Gemmatimonadaceae bacterium]
MSTYSIDPVALSIGVLIGRIAFGLLMAAHGAQKAFGWFGGPGLEKFGELMMQLGFRPGRVFAAAAALGEIASGLLVALGFLGPVGPALMLSVMVVAIVTVHWGNGLFAMSNGIELPLLYAIAAVVLAAVGYGAWSLDGALGLANRLPATVTWIILGAGIAGGFANAALRRRTAPAME